MTAVEAVTPGVRREFVTGPVRAAGDSWWSPTTGSATGVGAGSGAIQLHAPTVLVDADGRRLIAWFAGAHEGAADVRVQVACEEPGGGWTQPTDITGAPGPHWNPVLAHRGPGVADLYFKAGRSIQTWQTYLTRSRDGGRTWAPAVELVPGDTSGGRGPVRQAPLRWRELLVAGGSTEDWESGRWDCFVDLLPAETDPWGAAPSAWHQVVVPIDPARRARFRGAGVIQPCLWHNGSGGLTMLCRSTEGTAFRSSTADPWRWPPLEPVPLPNNNSGLAAVALPEDLRGRRLVACVHNPTSQSWGPRCPLVISVSDDDGRSWSVGAVVIEDGRGIPGVVDDDDADAGSASSRGVLRDAGTGARDGSPRSAAATGVVTTGRGEYSYPAVAVAGNELLVCYSWQRRGIVLASVPLSLLSAVSRRC